MNGLHVFTLAGIPVFVSIWFVLVVGYLGFRSAGEPAEGVLWVACVAVSILVHEFGHGLVSRHFGLRPQILLHGWGGLCAHERADSDRDDVLIIAAGPAAGLALGGLVWIAEQIIQATSPALAYDPMLWLFFRFMLFINIGWSLVNLLPLWPLDGGQLFRIGLLKMVRSPATAERVTHVTGLLVGATAALLAYFYFDSMFLVVLAGLLTYENLVRINASSASGPTIGVTSRRSEAGATSSSQKTSIESLAPEPEIVRLVGRVAAERIDVDAAASLVTGVHAE